MDEQIKLKALRSKYHFLVVQLSSRDEGFIPLSEAEFNSLEYADAVSYVRSLERLANVPPMR